MTFRRTVPAAAVVALAALSTFWHRPHGAPARAVSEASAFDAVGVAGRSFVPEPSRGQIVALPPIAATAAPTATAPPNPRPAVHRSTGNRPRPAVDGSTGGWARLRQCESSGDYTENTGNGFYGAYQFTVGTWRSVGGTGLPSSASPAEQDMRAQMLYASRGSQPWPVCGRWLR